MIRTTISFLFAAMALMAGAWGQKGHDVTAYIAEQHLTPRAKAAVDSIFEGKSIVYWANWLDNASHTMDYGHTRTWHYKNIDDGVPYAEAPLNPAGDVVRAVAQQIAILSDSTSTADQQFLALKILVHCMGDMHQPMHMGHASDRGGNNHKLKFFKTDTNLHSLWDGSLPESAHKWSYTEWQQQIDRATPLQQQIIVEGDLDTWAQETYDIATRCYQYFQPGMSVTYDHIAFWTPVIEQQLLRGGLRLAHVLNSIYE